MVCGSAGASPSHASSEQLKVKTGTMAYIERNNELKRKRKRRETVAKLKVKLAAAKNPTDQQAIVAKIKKVSPFWTPAE
jgi:hypothetical protein